jgi:phage tail-like protein
MPGMAKFRNITLKRGTFKGDNDYFEWLQTVQMNTVERRSITISLLDENGAPAVTWKVKNAFPLKLQSTDLKAEGNEVAIETLEIAHEGLTIEHN